MHISELAQHHVENPREVVSQGDPVNVLILEIDGDRRRLSLSLKRVEEGAEPLPRADGGESVHLTPNLRLSEEAFPAASGDAAEEARILEDEAVELAAEAVVADDLAVELAAEAVVAEAVAEELAEEALEAEAAGDEEAAPSSQARRSRSTQQPSSSRRRLSQQRSSRSRRPRKRWPTRRTQRSSPDEADAPAADEAPAP